MKSIKSYWIFGCDICFCGVYANSECTFGNTKLAVKLFCKPISDRLSLVLPNLLGSHKKMWIHRKFLGIIEFRTWPYVTLRNFFFLPK